MKLISYAVDGRETFGIVVGDGVIDLGSRVASPNLRMLIADEPDVIRKHADAAPDHRLDAIRFLPPIPEPGMLICLGLNTWSHLEEVRVRQGQEAPPPDKPWVFLRTARSMTGHREPLMLPNGSPLFDYEGEIALIIGKRARHLTPENALDHIFGFSCFNEGSIRDFQMHAPLYTAGKNFPRSGSFGPWIVTADEIGDVRDLTLTTRVNGTVVQEMRYDDLIFGFGEALAYISSFTDLEPGDVIVSGTAAGVGAMRDPPLWLRDGDVCEVEVDRIGTLVNRVAMASGRDRGPITREDAQAARAESLAAMQKK